MRHASYHSIKTRSIGFAGHC